MTKTIPTTLGILIIVLVAGMAGASVLFFNQEIEKEMAPEKVFIEENEVATESEQMPEEDEKTGEETSEMNGFSDWNTYRNKDIGFEIKYPKECITEIGDGYGLGFSIDIKCDVLLSLYIGIDQLDYYLRVRRFRDPSQLIEGTDIPLIENVELEENFFSEIEKSFKAKYLANSKNNITKYLEKEEKIEIFAEDSSFQNFSVRGEVYVLSCSGSHEKCDKLISTFRFLD